MEARKVYFSILLFARGLPVEREGPHLYTQEGRGALTCIRRGAGGRTIYKTCRRTEPSFGDEKEDIGWGKDYRKQDAPGKPVKLEQ